MIKRALILIVGVIVLVLAAVGVASVAGVSPFQSQRTDRSQPALLKSIKGVSQYNAAVGNFETVLDIEDNVAGVPNLISGRRTLFVAAGTVNAYADLSGFAAEDLTLSADGKSIILRLQLS